MSCGTRSSRWGAAPPIVCHRRLRLWSLLSISEGGRSSANGTPGTGRHSTPPGLAVSNEQVSVCPRGRIIVYHVPPESFFQVDTMFLSDVEDGIKNNIVGGDGSS